MKIEGLGIAGVYRLTPEPIHDERGFFARTFSRDQLRDLGIETDFPEWSQAFNHHRGTVRGLHMQREPFGETKIVQCVGGAVFDVAVDLREGSNTYGRHVAVALSAENRCCLVIPSGCAHGYQTLTDGAELLYHISAPYHVEAATGVRWDDATLGIAWPLPVHVISDRDRALPTLPAV